MNHVRGAARGQVLIIGAVAMVVLLGIAGLVIDLGFSWMLKRAEQNAVDPAAIAAARHLPSGDVNEQYKAACFYLKQHEFFTTDDATCSAARGSGELYVGPPTSGPFSGGGYVEVKINANHETFFSRIFGFGSMSVTSTAVAANGTGGSTAGQLVSLDPASCGAGQIGGNGTVSVGGSIYVRSDGSGCSPPVGSATDDTCSGSQGGFQFNGNNAVLVTEQLSVRGMCGQNANPYPAYGGGQCAGTCGLNEGAPDIGDPLFGLYSAPPIVAPTVGTSSSGSPVNLSGCDQPTDTGCNFAGGPGSWYELHPGVYYGGWTHTREVRLHPGIYYIAGGGIQQSGSGRLVTIGASGTADGTGHVLIYGADGPNCVPAVVDRRCQGPIQLEGNSDSAFMARSYDAAPYEGLLIWQAEGTSRTYDPANPSSDSNFLNDQVRVAGQGTLDFWGTIYAPKSLVDIRGQGTGTSTAAVQILSWRFIIEGNGTLEMPFDGGSTVGTQRKGLVH